MRNPKATKRVFKLTDVFKWTDQKGVTRISCEGLLFLRGTGREERAVFCSLYQRGGRARPQSAALIENLVETVNQFMCTGNLLVREGLVTF